jgi:hypothetical protein
MREAVVPVLMGVLVLGACGGAQGDAASSSVSPTTEQLGEHIVIRTRTLIAAEEGAEPIATGEVLEGSTLGGAPFCAGGTVLDSHASGDPGVERLIDRTITCPDGTVKVGFTPEIVPLGQTQTGSWTIISGTGAFENLRGSGEMEDVIDPDDDSLNLQTFTGTVTRSP